MVLEEEVGRSWDYRAKKGAHTYHSFVISYPWSLGGVLHNPQRLFHIFQWDAVCSCKTTNSWDWMLNIDCELPIVKTLRAIYNFLAVVLESSYIRFLSGPPDDPAWSCLHSQIWIKIQMGRRIVLVSLPQPTVICPLKIKKNEIMKFNSRK
jgi:hypothetical protein